MRDPIPFVFAARPGEAGIKANFTPSCNDDSRKTQKVVTQW
jgi:hypothetical protein